MARVTVEDCIEKVKNRFELVLMATKRAKDLERGSVPSVPRDNDKSTIIALREIAEETISLEGLKELAKRSLYEDIDPFSETETNEEQTVEEMMRDSDMDSDEDEDENGEEDLDEEDLKALADLDNALSDESEESEESEEEDK